MSTLKADELLSPDPEVRFPSFELMDLDERLNQLRFGVIRFLQNSPKDDLNLEFLTARLIGLSKELHRVATLLDEWILFFSSRQLVNWGSQLASNCLELLSILCGCKYRKGPLKVSQPRLLELIQFLDITSQQATWAFGYWLRWKEKHDSRLQREEPSPPTLDGLILACENELDYVRENGHPPYWAPRTIRELWHDSLQLGHPFIELPAIAEESINEVFMRQFNAKLNEPVWTVTHINQFVSFLTALLQWGIAQKQVDLFQQSNSKSSEEVTSETTPFNKPLSTVRIAQPSEFTAPDFVASDDFRSVRFKRHTFSFTTNQARCIQLLFENWKQGTPEIAAQTIMEKIDSVSNRLDDVFRKTIRGKTGIHPAWGTLIIRGKSKGAFRLKLPDLPD